jgi:hypothetical protein
LPAATIAVNKTAGSNLGAVDETLAAQTSDTGGWFRQVDCKYIHNLDTSSLSGVGTYNVSVDIGGTTIIASPGIFGLR